MGVVLIFTLFGLSNRLLEEYGYAFYYLGMERYGIGRILPIITFVGAGLLLSAIIVFVINNYQLQLTALKTHKF